MTDYEKKLEGKPHTVETFLELIKQATSDDEKLYWERRLLINTKQMNADSGEDIASEEPT